VPSLKGREVLAVGPRNLQKIVKSCNFYLTKCEGKDKELGAACRLVRELSREVQEQVEIIDQKSSEAASEHDRMSTLLEEYLTVFTDDASLKTDLRSVLGNEWADARRHNVLTPEILHDALMSSVSLIHSLKRDLVNSQVQRARDLPKFEQAVEALAFDKNQQISDLEATLRQSAETLRRERAAFDLADSAARIEAQALTHRQSETEKAAGRAAHDSRQLVEELQAKIVALHEDGRRRELHAARNAAHIHMAHIASLHQDAAQVLRTKEFH